jgi:hypothetical protein
LSLQEIVRTINSLVGGELSGGRQSTGSAGSAFRPALQALPRLQPPAGSGAVRGAAARRSLGRQATSDAALQMEDEPLAAF